MAYDDKEMLRDFNGVVLPGQCFDPIGDAFVLTKECITGGIIGYVSVTTTAVIAKAGDSELSNRAGLEIYNGGAEVLYWDYTTPTAASMPIATSGIKTFSFSPSVSVPIYISSTSTGTTAIIHEWE